MEIVVNEWLLEYLCLGANEEEFKKASKFISLISRKPYRIVIGKDTPFIKKLGRYLKYKDENSKTRLKKLYEIFLLNSDKTVIVDKSEIKKVPSEIIKITPPDDRYLIELTFSFENRIILTTDSRLKDIFDKKPEFMIKILLLDEFLLNCSI